MHGASELNTLSTRLLLVITMESAPSNVISLATITVISNGSPLRSVQMHGCMCLVMFRCMMRMHACTCTL